MLIAQTLETEILKINILFRLLAHWFCSFSLLSLNSFWKATDALLGTYMNIVATSGSGGKRNTLYKGDS